MSLQIPITALVGNDNNYYLDVTFNGDPLNLTGYTPHAYQKATQATSDGSALVYDIGSGLTWVNMALGKLKLTIPRANVTAAGIQWWKLNIVDGSGNVSTVMYGPMTVKAV